MRTGFNAHHQAEADLQEEMRRLDGASALQGHLRRLAAEAIDAISLGCPARGSDGARRVSEVAADKISKCLAEMIGRSWNRLDPSTSEWNAQNGLIAALGDRQVRAVVSNVWERNLHRSEDTRRKRLVSALHDTIRLRILKTPAIVTSVEGLLEKWLRAKGERAARKPEALTDLQSRILEELHPKYRPAETPTTADWLLGKLERGPEREGPSPSTLKAALKELTARGLIANRRSVGYYRTDMSLPGPKTG